MPNKLSAACAGGQLARSLVLDPDIVLFDSPTHSTSPHRAAVRADQEVHEENGSAYVVITHDIMSAKRVAEYIAVLWHRRIVESSPAEDLFNSDNQFVRQFLSGASQGRSAWSRSAPVPLQLRSSRRGDLCALFPGES